MNDQAFQLRYLKLQTSLEERTASASVPFVAALLGSKGGVGNTTIAAHLALALAARACRVGVVCTGTGLADLAAISGISELTEIHDGSPVTWRENLRLYGSDDARSSATATGGVFSHWYQTASSDTDVLICDCGSWSNQGQPLSRFEHADRLIITTTADNLALMDTYAFIKQLAQDHPTMTSRLQILVNQVSDRAVTHESLDRLQLTCRRFLGLELKPATFVKLATALAVPIDPEHRPNCLAEELAQQLHACMLAEREADASRSGQNCLTC